MIRCFYYNKIIKSLKLIITNQFGVESLEREKVLSVSKTQDHVILTFSSLNYHEISISFITKVKTTLVQCQNYNQVLHKVYMKHPHEIAHPLQGYLCDVRTKRYNLNENHGACSKEITLYFILLFLHKIIIKKNTIQYNTSF